MPLIYGEGRQKSLDRLQRKVLKSSSHVLAGSEDTPWVVPLVRAPRSTSLESQLESSKSKGESMLQAHKTFDDWLSSFSNPSNTSADNASLEEFRMRKGRFSALARQHDDIPPLSNRVLLTKKVHDNPIRDGVGYLGQESKVLENGIVRLVFWDLEKPGSPECFTQTMDVRPNESLNSIISRLFERGYHRICGFRGLNRGDEVYPPILPFDAPFYPVITAGDSCYDISSGLKINQHQRLVDYFNDFHRINLQSEATMVPKLNNSGCVSIADRNRHCALTISFRRTLRIPEDGKTYQLPACFDNFQLFKVDDFVNKLPDEMAIKGGMFFPMFQREAVALAFDATAPDRSKNVGYDRLLRNVAESFAVKIYAGSINCLSGKAHGDSPATNQDYVVCPQQVRLDGFVTSTGEVNQFVTMPLSWGYSVEKQVIGSESIAGIQLQIARRLRDDVEFERPFNALDTEATEKLDLFQSPSQLRMAAGQLILMRDLTTSVSAVKFDLSDLNGQAHQFPKYVPVSESKCRPVFVSDIIQRNCSESGNVREIVLKPITPIRVRIDWASMRVLAGNKWEEFSPFLDVSEFTELISETMRKEHVHEKTGFFYFNDTILSASPQRYIPIKNLGLDDGIVYMKPARSNSPDPFKHLTDALAGAEGGLIKSDWATNAKAGWEMCVGVGGKLKQHIYPTIDKRLWDWKNACFLNVQLLNSVALKSMTGVSPWSPISFREYTERSIPFFSFIPADAGTLESANAKFRIVTDLQNSQEVLRIGFAMNGKSAVGCANCEVNLCDTLLVSCNHIWCSDCIRTDMLRAGKTTCSYCQVVSEEVIPFAAPAELPQKATNSFFRCSKSEPISLHDEEVMEGILSLHSKLRLVLPFRFKDTECAPTADEALNAIITVAERIMKSWGNRFDFNLMFASIKDASAATRVLVARHTFKLARSRYYLERLLILVSSADELGESNLSHLIKDDKYNLDGSLPRILDWAMEHSLSFADLGVPVASRLAVDSTACLDRVLRYLTSLGISISDDYGARIAEVVKVIRPSMVIPTVRALASRGRDVNALDDEGKNILFRSENEVMTYEMLDIGVRADIADREGNTPVHLAASKAERGILKFLLAHATGRRAVNMCNGQGLTPYHISLGCRRDTAVNMLVRAGANVNIPITHKEFRDELEARVEEVERDSRFKDGRKWIRAVRAALRAGSNDGILERPSNMPTN